MSEIKKRRISSRTIYSTFNRWDKKYINSNRKWYMKIYIKMIKSIS
jgi:hypothetical protein